MMSDNHGLAITRRDRALLQAVVQGLDLRQVAAMRGEAPGHVRVELQRVLAVLLNRRQPLLEKRARFS